MAQLAIKGHATRGKEVIEILEMLGGHNIHYMNASDERSYYYNSNDNVEILSDSIKAKRRNNDVVYTLEEFLEKFPYKVGDKVCFPDDLSTPFTINKMWWDENANELLCSFVEDDIEIPVDGVGAYKEETVENNINYCQVGKIKAVCFQDTNYEDKVELQLGNNYEIKEENGKYYAVKKQFKYPKTYKDCCDVLGLSTMDNDAQGYKGDLIIRFQELLIARDAYWKIAGEQMGLDKPWEPDWVNAIYTCTIICRSNKIVKDAGFDADNRILGFPTEKIRDAFYDNFKDMIEECKEFL